ncbi:MAG: sigma-54 dependent transcriptional regulator [Alphaproteobacteria bacterium]|nr:sigma-54 dependent transcriptional regulator [Alphaproteobacteria bacterium]
MHTHTIVVLSTDDGLVAEVSKALEADPSYRIIICQSEREAELRLNALEAHLLICGLDAVEDLSENILQKARIFHPLVARLLIGPAERAPDCAVLARNTGVYLYALRPAPIDLLQLFVKRALEVNELARRHRVLSRELKISMDDDLFNEGESLSVSGGVSQFEKLVYASPLMAELCAEAKQAAGTELPVLIQGETGTGKELLARAIHYNSARMNSPIHVQNCGGVSDDMLHSELFGHIRGAFTGAISDRLGLFRAADGGTVFLDEISEVSPSFQVSLLRFLQEGEVKPLGSDTISHSDVRVVAASNRSLAELVEKGEFRRDLYYRLKGFELTIPPLRSRREDIPALTQFFIEKYSGVVGRRVVGVAQDALIKLEAYQYPGNVRELESEIRRMVAVAEQGGYISARHLSSAIADAPVAPAEAGAFTPQGGNLKEMVESLERELVASTLVRTHWNQSKAAAELGLSRVGLANKIKRYGLQNA